MRSIADLLSSYPFLSFFLLSKRSFKMLLLPNASPDFNQTWSEELLDQDSYRLYTDLSQRSRRGRRGQKGDFQQKAYSFLTLEPILTKLCQMHHWLPFYRGCTQFCLQGHCRGQEGQFSKNYLIKPSIRQIFYQDENGCFNGRLTDRVNAHDLAKELILLIFLTLSQYNWIREGSWLGLIL